MAESSASADPRTSGAMNRITIVELGHNSANIEVEERHIDVATYERLLADPGKVDSPLLDALGYPVIIVSTQPGRKCIPQVQMVAVSNNRQNNRMATVAASRLATGLAMGCVIGNAYALRVDGKNFTKLEWEVLWDILLELMDEYGEGPGHVNAQLLAEYKRRVRSRMRAEGLLKRKAAGTGVHCFECGEEENEETQLLRCSRCKTARYCSKACQKAHWSAGHKHTCKPAGEDSEENKKQRLLETAVLRPEQVIARNAAVPGVPAGAEEQLQMMAQLMPPDMARLFVFNKSTRTGERICPSCRTHYRLLAAPAADDRAAAEQELSGICSFACFQTLNPAGPHSGSEWYGQSAEQPEGVVIDWGNGVVQGRR